MELLFTSWNNFHTGVALLTVALLLISASVHFLIIDSRRLRRFRAKLMKYSVWTPLLTRGLTGILLIVAAVSGKLFAPEFQIAPVFGISIGPVIASIELLLGLALVAGIYPRLLGGIGIVLYLVGFFSYGVFNFVQYIFLLGVFIYLLLNGDPALPKIRTELSVRGTKLVNWFEERRQYALTFLRIGFGLSMLASALLTKLFYPQVAFDVLANYNIDLTAKLAAWGIDGIQLLFVFAMAELLFSLLVIFGFLPRLCGFLLFIVFTCALALLNVQELIRHLPLYAVLYALFTAGGGERWSAERQKK